MEAKRQSAADREILAGLIERVTFHNEESGFCVLRVKALGQRDLVTIVGHAAATGAGEFVQASGRWINDRTHGVQFRADFLKAGLDSQRAQAPDITHFARHASAMCWRGGVELFNQKSPLFFKWSINKAVT